MSREHFLHQNNHVGLTAIKRLADAKSPRGGSVRTARSIPLLLHVSFTPLRSAYHRPTWSWVPKVAVSTECGRVGWVEAALQLGGDVGALYLRQSTGSAACARRALSHELTGRRAGNDVIFDATLIATELLSNAIQHASPLKTGHFRLFWRIDEGQLHIEVHDGGSPTAPQIQSANPTDVAGRGLAIVDAIADRWGIESHEAGRCVWAALAVRPSPDRGATHGEIDAPRGGPER